MEKQILKDYPGKLKGYKISVGISKNGTEGNVYIKKTIRKDGVSTSCNIANLGPKSSLGDDKNIVDLANDAFLNWKKGDGKATVFFYENEDCENEDINLGQVYIYHFLNELGILRKFDSLKGEKKSKYQFNLKDVAGALICSQILNPGSKRHMYLSEKTLPFPDGVKLQHIYRTLDILARHSDEINAYSYKKIKELSDKKTAVYFYDCTNFYYTQGSDGTLLGMKKSKEGIYAPLVQMGLLIDEWGYLVGMIIFKGNYSEQRSLQEQIEKISPHIKMSEVTVCTDAGLCSCINKLYLSQNGRSYITTQPVTGRAVPTHIKDWVIKDSDFKNSKNAQETVENLKSRYEKAKEEEDYEKMNSILSETIYKDAWYGLQIVKRTAKKTKGKRNKWVETVCTLDDDLEEKEGVEIKLNYSKEAYNNAEDVKGDSLYTRLLVSFSMKYYLFQKKELEEKRKKAEEIIKDSKKLDSVPKDLQGYLTCVNTTSNGEIAEVQNRSIDEEAFKEAEKYLGYYVQATNLGNPTKELYQISRMRWQIEYCFRTMKTCLDSRPIYLTTETHIKGHFTLVFLALQTLRYMMYKLYKEEGNDKVKLGRAEKSIVTVDAVLEELRNMRGRKFHAQEGYDFINGSKKNEMNILMAKAFGKSLTKQVMKKDKLEEYSGVKL